MAQPYTVVLPGGGSVTVNANSPEAARQNAGVGGDAQVYAGGHQTTQDAGGNTVYNPNANVGAGEVGRAQNAGGSSSSGSGNGSGGGTGTGSVNVNGQQIDGASSGAIDAYLSAIASGNKADADEAIRKFNLTFGLDQQKFQASVDQFAQNFGLAQAGLTGMYNGKETLAAQQQKFSQGLSALSLAQSVQANPFKQAQVLYGEGAYGFTPAMAAAAGMGSPLPSFQAPNGSAANTATLGWLASQTGGAAGGGGYATNNDVNASNLQADPNYDPNGAQPQLANPANKTTGSNLITPLQNTNPADPNYNPNAAQPQIAAPGRAAPVPTSGPGSAMQNSLDYLHGLNPTLKDPAYQQVLLNSRGWVYWPGENLDPNTHLPTTGSYPGIKATATAPAAAAANPGAGATLPAQTAPGGQAGGGTSYVQDQANHWLNTLPSPNQVNWTAVNSGGPGVMDLVTKGLAQKWGIGEPDIQAIAKATMPQFAAPTLAGSFKG